MWGNEVTYDEDSGGMIKVSSSKPGPMNHRCSTGHTASHPSSGLLALLF